MTPRHDLDSQVQHMQAAAEKALLAAHPSGEAMPVIRKMQQLLRGLNFSTHRIAVALFASVDTGKLIYLDFVVKPTLIVDKVFRIRDLADCKPDGKDFLLLLVSGNQSKTYVSEGGGLRLIKSNSPQNLYAFLNEIPEKTGNFSTTTDRHEVMLNKFLHHMDEGLGAVLKVWPLPVFVAGTERIAGHFSRITRHDSHIAGYIYKHCIYASEPELENLMHPLLENWQQVNSRLLLSQMEKAAGAGKLVCGIEDVRKAAQCSNSRVIIVEGDAFSEESSGETFYREDPVDEVIEKVLENGGTVEKLDKASLSTYGDIALIRYY
jgi:hypothetical protein